MSYPGRESVTWSNLASTWLSYTFLTPREYPRLFGARYVPNICTSEIRYDSQATYRVFLCCQCPVVCSSRRCFSRGHDYFGSARMFCGSSRGLLSAHCSRSIPTSLPGFDNGFPRHCGSLLKHPKVQSDNYTITGTLANSDKQAEQPEFHTQHSRRQRKCIANNWQPRQQQAPHTVTLKPSLAAVQLVSTDRKPSLLLKVR